MRALLLVTISACSFAPGVVIDGGTDMMDRPIDMPDMFDPLCFGKMPFTVCLQTMPTEPLTLAPSINTGDTAATRCTAVGGAIVPMGEIEVCALAGTDVTIMGTMVGVGGPRPLVVIATNKIDVTTADFDITSGELGNGPNANPTDCTSTGINGASDSSRGGGGAGGSFGGTGGDGGDGNSGGAVGGAAPAAVTAFDKLRGGCPGGTGAAGGGAIGAAGSGGGAVYLVARSEIHISGMINASGGGGGAGSASRGGGGGGGSGGMIVLHAPTLTIDPSARIFSHGGGGGGGATNGTSGGRGEDGLVFDAAALGGAAGGTTATAGGAGALGSTPAVGAANATDGGGGGGGGVGVIRVLSGQTIPATNASPTPIAN